MKIDIRFVELEALVQRMGAARKEWTPQSVELEPLEELRRKLTTGIEIKASEIEYSRGGLLTYKNQQVVLYIKDTRQDRDTLLNRPEEARKFHLAYCKTLEKMARNGRFERYVVTLDTSGQFQVIATEQETRKKSELKARLNVCKNCLSGLGYKGYSHKMSEIDKSRHVDSFSTAEFFRDYQTFFPRLPGRHDFELGPRDVGYVENWDRISRSYRESERWRCEDCGVDLSGRKGLLHTHHIDMNPRNNRESNLRALCVLCHAGQPNHSHMGVTVADRQKIEKLRVTQTAKFQSHSNVSLAG